MKVQLTIQRSLAGILSVPVALPVSKNVNFSEHPPPSARRNDNW